MHRFIFFLLILAIALLLLCPILLYLFGASALRTFDATYEIFSSSVATYGVKNCSFGTDHFRASIDRMVLPKPLFLLSELILGRQIANGIQIQRLQIRPMGSASDPDGEEPSGGPSLDRTVNSAVKSLLRCPLLSLPAVSIDGIFFDRSPVYLSNFRIGEGYLSFDVLEREPGSPDYDPGAEGQNLTQLSSHGEYGSVTGEKKCSIHIEIRSLRRALREYLAAVDQPGLTPEIVRLLRGSITMHRFPLHLLERVLPSTLKPEGMVDGDLTFQLGRVSGVLELRDLQTWPLPWVGALQNISLALQFDGQRLSFRDCRGRTGDREFVLTGSVGWSGGDPIWNLHLTGADLPFIRTGNVNLRGNLDLSLRTDDQRTILAGDIDMVRGLLTSDTLSLASEFRRLMNRASALQGPDFWGRIALDIALHGDKFLRVNSTYLRGLLSVQLAIGGEASRPTLTGKITVNDGHILFPFARFRIASGSIDFDPLTDPKISISAETRLYGYDLQLLVDGEPKRPILNLSSVPSLANAEIVTMITSGRIPDHLLNGNPNGNQWGALNFYLNSGFFGENFPENIHMQIGEDITENGLETMEIEYVFDRRRSLIGQYDRFDNYNVDYRFRIYAR